MTSHVSTLHFSVTDLLVHPLQHDVLFSASADGTVKYFDCTNYAAAHVHGSSNTAGKGQSADISESDFVPLLSEPAAVTSLDYSADANMLLATSAIGSMWRVQL